MHHNSIKHVTKEDYIKVYNDLERFCKINTHLLLFGEFGDASYPSISDLDIFICLEDDNFEEEKNQIIRFIEDNEIRKYIFFHIPLILPKSILPFFKHFHTAYNLNITYQNNNTALPKTSIEQQDFLNFIWSTYLMGIGPGILINPNFSVRDKLLVLKNICQSITNIDPKSGALTKSKELRNRAMDNKISKQEIDASFEALLRQLFKEMNNLAIAGIKEESEREKVKVSFNKTFYKATQNDFSINEDKIDIHLNPTLFNLLLQFYNRKSSNNLIQTYIDLAVNVNSECKKLKTMYPFICPFGYQFYRTDVKFAIKKKMLSL